MCIFTEGAGSADNQGIVAIALASGELPGGTESWAVEEMLEAELIRWTEQSKAKGRIAGQTAMLVSLARQRFGEASASAIVALLRP